MQRTPKSFGFTLLEVMVALAVLAIALGAAVAASGRYTENAAYLRDKTLAHWVAMNLIAEMQLLDMPPPSEVSTGTAGMAGRDWQWQSRITDTSDSNVRKIEVDVLDYLDHKNVLISATGYLVTAPISKNLP